MPPYSDSIASNNVYKLRHFLYKFEEKTQCLCVNALDTVNLNVVIAPTAATAVATATDSTFVNVADFVNVFHRCSHRMLPE